MQIYLHSPVVRNYNFVKFSVQVNGKFTSDQSLVYNVSAYSLDQYQPDQLDLIFFSLVCEFVMVWS